MTCIEAIVELLAEAHEAGMTRKELWSKLDWGREHASAQVMALIREGHVVAGYPRTLWLTESAPTPLPVNPRKYKRVPAVCPECGEEFLIRPCDQRRGTRYCSRLCSANARRVDPGDKKRRKTEYDRARRNGPKRDEILQKKRDHYRANSDYFLQKQAERRASPEYRAKMQEYGKNYRQDPEWKRHKREYDRKYRAVRLYGQDLAPAYLAFLALTDHLQTEGDGNSSRQYERGRHNRTIKNRRDIAKDQA